VSEMKEKLNLRADQNIETAMYQLLEAEHEVITDIFGESLSGVCPGDIVKLTGMNRPETFRKQLRGQIVARMEEKMTEQYLAQTELPNIPTAKVHKLDTAEKTEKTSAKK
jgi:hypothetical protein